MKSSIEYFIPDLTKNQHEEAFKLREEKRHRIVLGEKNLKISRSKIVVVPEPDDGQNGCEG